MFELLFASKVEIRVFEKFGESPVNTNREPYLTINYNRDGAIILHIPAKGRENDQAMNPWLQGWLQDLASNPENGLKEVYYTSWEFADKKSLKKFLHSLDSSKFEIVYS
mgnify:CR=1 FL=1